MTDFTQLFIACPHCKGHLIKTMHRDEEIVICVSCFRWSQADEFLDKGATLDGAASRFTEQDKESLRQVRAVFK